MKLYIYDTETMKIVAIAFGKKNTECETKAIKYIGTDKYAGTYTPAFGCSDGLIEAQDVEIL